MKRVIFSFLILCMSGALPAQEARSASIARRGEGSYYSSRDATALSMMGWGIGLAVGIATLFALLDNNATAEGGGGHTH